MLKGHFLQGRGRLQHHKELQEEAAEKRPGSSAMGRAISDESHKKENVQLKQSALLQLLLAGKLYRRPELDREESVQCDAGGNLVRAR